MSKIMVAVTDSESGAEAINVEDYFEEEKEEEEEEEGGGGRGGGRGATTATATTAIRRRTATTTAAATTTTTTVTTTTNKQTSLGRSRTTGCNKLGITNLGNVSRKEHKYSSCYIYPFVGPAKGVKKVRFHTPTNTARHCVDVVFHRNFSSAGGTDQCILPATLRQTS
jgi:hypothetical protein